MQESSSGGVLLELTDKGMGAPDTRFDEMNWRLDNPSAIDVSDSRHMGLFAVARLAHRHGIRVRLRPAPEAGLSALVWLPARVIQRTSRPGTAPGWPTLLAGARRAAGDAVPGGQVSPGSVEDHNDSDPAVRRTPLGWFRGTWEGTEGAGPGDTTEAMIHVSAASPASMRRPRGVTS